MKDQRNRHVGCGKNHMTRQCPPPPLYLRRNLGRMAYVELYSVEVTTDKFIVVLAVNFQDFSYCSSDGLV